MTDDEIREVLGRTDPMMPELWDTMETSLEETVFRALAERQAALEEIVEEVKFYNDPDTDAEVDLVISEIEQIAGKFTGGK